MREAWIKVWIDWKGGRREVLNVRALIFEQNPVTGIYRCEAFRKYSNGGHSIIRFVSKNDIVKFINGGAK